LQFYRPPLLDRFPKHEISLVLGSVSSEGAPAFMIEGLGAISSLTFSTPPVERILARSSALHQKPW
jgi:hypothetical protein